MKGGTSLPKCRLGSAGRFSTDLDFVAPNDDKVLAVAEAIHGATVSGFKFALQTTRGDGRHWVLQVRHPTLGQPDVPASVEFARRPLVRAAEPVAFVPSSVHGAYGLGLPTLPVTSEAEACAEKLARYRRIRLSRDVYDLAQFAGRRLDEALLRRLWVLKVWEDVVLDRRGERPLEPAEVLAPRREADFARDSLGKLTHPTDIPAL